MRQYMRQAETLAKRRCEQSPGTQPQDIRNGNLSIIRDSGMMLLLR